MQTLGISPYRNTLRFFIASCEAGARERPRFAMGYKNPNINLVDTSQITIGFKDFLLSLVRPLYQPDNEEISKLLAGSNITNADLMQVAQEAPKLDLDDLRAAKFFSTIWQSTKAEKKVENIFSVAHWRFQQFLQECKSVGQDIPNDLLVRPEPSLEFLVEAYCTTRGVQYLKADLGLVNSSDSDLADKVS